MFEKLLVTGYVLFLIAIGKVAPDDHFWTDRINQNIPETVSYAKVSKNSQDHRNVQAIDPATGKKLPYRIKRVGGYDPSRQYIAIDHKGQYVHQITYISKAKYLAAKNKLN